MGKIYNQKIQNHKRKKLRNEMTKAEVLLWMELKDKKILGYKFRRQFSIGSYVVDFYCPELNLAVEVDGATHVTDEEIRYDKDRQTEIETLGIKFLRFSNPEIYKDMNHVLEKIKSIIEELKSSG